MVSQGEADITLAIQATEGPTSEAEEGALDWRIELEVYLKEGTLLTESKMISTMIRRVKCFIVLDGVLFKKSFGRPLL